jgi:oligoendopeptidase F
MTPNTPTFTQTRWSLTDLFPGPQSAEIENAFTDLQAKVADFEKVRPQLRPEIPVDEFLRVIQQLELITRLTSKLHGYAGLWFSENTQNQAAQGMVARVNQFTVELSNRILFFDLWWKDLEDAAAQRLMGAAGDVRYWLEAKRYFKPHTLTEPEEKIVNIKDVTGASALKMLYSSITNRYTFKVEVNGEVRELTRGELMACVRQADPELRAHAYQELYRVYGVDGPILGLIYQNLVRDWHNENITLRKFASPIAVRNLVNDIPNKVVEILLDVAQQNVGVFQRFFRLKARWLGMERIRRYDLYAPVALSEKHYDFNQAAVMVMDSFQQFNPHFAQLAQRVLEENHLDSEIRKGKRSGAFCATINPDLTPWVHLNYQGRPDDVATMAHELGHAIHSLMAADHSAFTQHACLPLAETASTFGEMMLVDRLMEIEEDEGVRRDLLFRQVDDAYATIQRQVFFALFEKQAHMMIHKGASVDDLSAAYMENMQRQFGDAVGVNDEFRWEWVSIPHIFDVPFYVYAYSFGQLLVLSLYQQFKVEGETFKLRYMRILSAGGSVAPVQLLAQAGIDIRKAEFWQGGFDAVNSLVTSLETLPVTR